MKFGEKLKYFAKEKFGSLTNLANALGMSIGHLSQYVNEINKPGMDFFLKLQNLGCDINWLLSDDEGPPPETDKFISDKIKELEEENRLLRDQISQISLLTKIIEDTKKKKGQGKKNK